MQLIIIGAENSAIPLHKTSIREEKTMYTLHYLHCQNLVENLWDLVLGRGLWKKRLTGRPEPGLEACLSQEMRREGGEFQNIIKKPIMLLVKATQDRMSQLNNNNNSSHHRNLLRPQNHRKGLLRHRQIRSNGTDRFRRKEKTLTKIVPHPLEVEMEVGTEVLLIHYLPLFTGVKSTFFLLKASLACNLILDFCSMSRYM